MQQGSTDCVSIQKDNNGNSITLIPILCSLKMSPETFKMLSNIFITPFCDRKVTTIKDFENVLVSLGEPCKHYSANYEPETLTETL